MLILDAMTHIYKIFDQDMGTLDIDSDDFLVRMAKYNEAINIWETEEGILWNELFLTATGTTSNNDGTIDLPAGFVFPAGKLRLTGSNGITLFDKKLAKDYQEYEKLNPNHKFYYITGGDGAKVCNVNPVPTTANGLAALPYKLDYYSHATTYSAGDSTTPIQMSDPWFGIHYVLAYLYTDDENTTQAAVHTQIYSQKLKAMVTKNEIPTWYEDDQLPDVNGGGFGI